MTSGFKATASAMVRHRALLVRAAIRSEAEALSALSIQVWLQTYATDGVSQTLARHVLNTYSPAQFMQWISDRNRLTLVALQGDNLIGFALTSFDTAALNTVATPELLTLYVQTRFIGLGVGTALLRATQNAVAQRSGDCRLTLSVNAENSAAIGFYRHHGFDECGTTNFYLDTVAHKNYVLRGPASTPQPDCDQIRAVRFGENGCIAGLITKTLESSVDASKEEKTIFLANMVKNLTWASRNPDACIHLVFVRAQRIVGVVLIKENSHLCTLMVNPADHRSGVGAALLRLAVILCRQSAPGSTILLNASRNAVGFYLAHGFKKIPGAQEPLRATRMQLLP